VAAVILLTAGLSQFLSQISLIEAREIQASILSALLRNVAVFIVIVFVANSMAREISEKVSHLLLAHPVPRWQYFLGKFLAFLALSAGISLAFSLTLAPWAQATGLIWWGLSLLGELAILATLTLFLSLSVSPVTAMSTAMGYYVLSRSMTTLQLIASASVADSATVSDSLIAAIMHAVGILLPNLDNMTLSFWLISPPTLHAMFRLLVESSVYLGLLASAAIFDLYRRNF
jgi:ABC-type transport system involved in multi-copper enzyme maturation permease subunit